MLLFQVWGRPSQGVSKSLSPQTWKVLLCVCKKIQYSKNASVSNVYKKSATKTFHNLQKIYKYIYFSGTDIHFCYPSLF